MPDLSIKAKFWKINNHLNNGNENKINYRWKIIRIKHFGRLFVLKTLILPKINQFLI